MFSRIEKAYLIGEAAEQFTATLAPHVPCEQSATLQQAVASAAANAAASSAAEPVVLFSPACASFDQYHNFEIRGDAFRDLAMALQGISTVTAGADR